MNKDALRSILESPIAFHKVFATIGGGAATGLFLSQAYYWTGRGDDKNGWFHKTQEQWTAETMLNRSEQEHARKVLTALGILETKKVGMPCRVYYRVDIDALFAAINSVSQFAENDKQECRIQQTRMQDSADKNAGFDKQECRIQHSIKGTETTTETTRDYNKERESVNAPTIPVSGGVVSQPIQATPPIPVESAKPNKTRRANTGTRLPDDWEPSPELWEWAVTGFPSVNVAIETEKFCDYFRAASGASAVKCDWEAAWRNWIRRTAERAPTIPPNAPNRFSTAPEKVHSLPYDAAPENRPRRPSMEQARANVRYDMEILRNGGMEH